MVREDRPPASDSAIAGDGSDGADGGDQVDALDALDRDGGPTLDGSGSDVVDAIDAPFDGDEPCADTQGDPLNCGSCGNICTAPDGGTPTCAAGTCGFACPPGFEQVGGRCEELSPRLIAPLSTATVWNRRPHFRWDLSGDLTGARIEICANRACSSMPYFFDANGVAGAPVREFTVPMDLPPGTFFWRLRGMRAAVLSTRTSAVWQFRVGNSLLSAAGQFGLEVDVNGDGIGDVIVGSTASRVYVFHGTRGAWPTTPSTTLLAPAGSIQFGAFSIAGAGDVNGDGFTDVIVGAQGSASAYVFHGGPSGLSDTPATTLAGESASNFGIDVAGIEDVDGDGYSDVAVASDGARRVSVFRGGPNGVSSVVAAEPLPPTGTPPTQFGSPIASAGDVNRDGFADIVVASDRRLLVYHGSASGISTIPDGVVSAGSIGFMSAARGVGDVNQDGYADIAAGVTVDQGAGMAPTYTVTVYLGGPSGTSTTAYRTIMGTGTPNVMSAGDIDGNGYGDILIGTGKASVIDQEGATLYRFTMTGMSFQAAPDPGVSGFGLPIGASNDFDGDGIYDLLVSGYYSDRVFVFSVLSNTTPPVSHEVPVPADATGFGKALAE